MANYQLNILYHHRTQGRGAEGVHISCIVKALECLGHKVTVLSPPGVNPLDNAGNAPVDKSHVKTKGFNSIWKFISKKLPNFLFEFIEIFYNLPAAIRLERKLSTGEYDLIYERYAFYMIAGAIKAKKYGLPLILEVNEVNGIKDRARKQSFPRLCGCFERFLFKRCMSIHAVSSYLKNMIINQGIKDTDIVVTPNAIDPEEFKGKKDSGSLRSKYNLENRLVIGFAGWFDEWDRLDLLIDVFSSLKVKYKNLSLLLIGDGVVLETVRQKSKLVNLENDIIMTGAVPRVAVRQNLALLDIAVITHTNEFGSPVVMFEFMGLRIPIIAPNLLPITDVLTHNENALIFNVLDMNQLENGLTRLIDDDKLRSHLANSAYDKLVSEHTWYKNAEKIISTSGLI